MSDITRATLDEYPKDGSPTDKKDYWQIELKSAQKRLSKWQKQSDDITKRFLGSPDKENTKLFRLNLFNSNIKTMMSMMYGKLPRVDVSRVDSTGNDDAARVAAEMIERMLRSDVEASGQSLDSTLYAALQDRLLGGLGIARVRYEYEEISVEAGVGTASGTIPLFPPQKTIYEAAPIDYYYWADVLWGWGRTFDEIPWVAFRSYLTKDEVEKRFGEQVARGLEYKQQQVTDIPDAGGTFNPDLDSAWQKAEIWEIWDKASKKVCWFSFSYSRLLDSKDDPLKLANFYPCPPFFIANTSTSLYIPTPDFALAQDLYNEIDRLQSRIAILTDAVKAVGVYDKSAEGVQRMFREGMENDLIPVDNWAMFAEKGGLRGQVDWLPIEAVVGALDKLTMIRDQTIGLLQQTTGMSDIMRGDLNNQYEGVGQSKIKAQFGSSRMQALQEQFAGFVSGLMQIKAEIISRHFDPQTIIKQSGIEFSYDAQLAPQAIQLIKNPDEWSFRVDIKPETMAQMDYAQLQAERAAYLNGLSTFLSTASPLIQQDPRSLPFLLQMLKWAMAGFKGASEIEGVLDQAIDTMSQPQAQEEAQKPDPEQIRAETQVKLEQIRQQAKAQEIQMKLQADMQMREADRQADIATEQARTEMEVMRLNAETQAEMMKLQAKMEADVRTEYMTSKFDAEQARETARAQVEAELVKAQAAMAQQREKSRVDISLKVLEKQFDARMKAAEMQHESRENEKEIQARPSNGETD